MPGRSGVRRVHRADELIKARRDEYDVRTMCRVLDVARAGYYASERRRDGQRLAEICGRLSALEIDDEKDAPNPAPASWSCRKP